MKKAVMALVLALVLLSVPVSLFAGITSGSILQFDTPFLLTSGGQGAGSKTLRTLGNRTALKDSYGETGKWFLEDETPERYGYIDSGYFKTLVIVISVTEKGLGASGITIEDEIGFLKEVLSKAKAQNMKIIAISMEQDARAPKLPTNGNERIIDLVCPQADWIISIKANNTDGRFTKISEQYGIPLTVVDKATELMVYLPQIFSK
ncbi:MAG: hypothetical protein J5891_10210 [Spirochaetales bacterium]|nr:hypothetical protein [Spirochaetales bacterium]